MAVNAGASNKVGRKREREEDIDNEDDLASPADMAKLPSKPELQSVSSVVLEGREPFSPTAETV